MKKLSFNKLYHMKELNIYINTNFYNFSISHFALEIFNLN